MKDLWPVFETLGSDLYKGMVSDLKKFKDSEEVPNRFHYLSAEEWAAWRVYWGLPLVMDQAWKNSQNRNAEPRDGRGTSRHHYGSRAVVTRRLASVSIYIFQHVFSYYNMIYNTCIYIDNIYNILTCCNTLPHVRSWMTLRVLL